ncbi:MAG: SH3 domain-containing protein [Anaerolineales bacterium]|nr:SH3 domain-containing protein [Anaerolineales bacterium]
MNYRLRVSLPTLVLLAAMFACNLPVEQVPPPGEVQTAAALTVQALMVTQPSAEAGLPSPTPSPTPDTPSPINSPSQTTTVTPTYSVPMLTVKESTNCRTGPGEAYEIVFTYLSGKKLEIVGHSDRGNFWLVKSNESPTGTCWLWGEYVDVTGSYWAVSSVTPPPTTTSAPPIAPSIQKWDYFCSGGTLTFTVNWKDLATGETGYRVFRNGEQVAELPANSTTYTDTYNLSGDFDQNVEYYLQVYGPAGSANSSVIRMRCGE